MNNNREFIQALKASKFYPMITENVDPIMIYIGGSRLTGVADEQSDYDIQVIIEDGSWNGVDSGMNGLSLEWRGTHVDFFYAEYSAFMSSNCASNGCPAFTKSIAPMQFRFLTEDSIIYENPVHADEVNSLKLNKYSISDSALLSFFKNNAKLAKKIRDDGFDWRTSKKKYAYHLCYLAYHCLNQIPDVEFLRTMKNGAKRELTLDELAKARELISALYDHMEENHPDCV